MPEQATSLRLFFALWPDDATREALAAWASAAHRSCGGRVTRSESIHLTLAFLGDVASERVPDALAAAQAVTITPFVWMLDQLDYWPHNQIAWAGSRHAPQVLATLAIDLMQRLRAAGFALERERFVPHVTLIRRATRALRDPHVTPIAWYVDAVRLVKSTRDADGSRYECVQEWRASNEQQPRDTS